MAAGLALSRANIETPTGGLLANATVLVRQNVLTIKERGSSDPAVFQAGVTEVRRVTRTLWTITTADGVYTVTRSKDCGCRK